MADAMAGLRRASPGATEALGPGPHKIAVSRTRTGRAVQPDLQRVYANTKKHSGAGFHCRVRSTRFRRLIVRSARASWHVGYFVICMMYRYRLTPRVLVLSFNLMFNLHHTTCSCTCFTNPPPTPVHAPVTAVVNAENTDTSLLIKTKQSKHASRYHTHR